MKPPKFRVQCSECGKRSNIVTAWTIQQWMVRHEKTHQETR